MTATDPMSARLTVLETVLRQLVTHMAVRDDDPPAWVRTRKTLAMQAVDRASGAEPSLDDRIDGLRNAVAGFFEPVEDIAGAYRREGTRPPAGR